MKVRVIKARKALGFTAYVKHMGKLFDPDLNPEAKKLERELELYKKPGFYQNRTIKVVDRAPQRPRSEIVYVSFNKTGYEIRSGRNFIHGPIREPGNLRYACVDLEHLVTEEERKSVLDDLIRLNNGKPVKY